MDEPGRPQIVTANLSRAPGAALLDAIPPGVRARWPIGAGVLALVLVAAWWHEPTVRLKAGMTVGQVPLQTNVADLESPPVPWQKDGLWVHPLARYELQARVLSRERYKRGEEARLSPYDLALGWTTMSDQTWIDALDISQRGRWYNLQAKESWVDAETVLGCSANTHIIPGNDAVLSTLGDVRRGDVVELAGWLVEAKDEVKGWSWRSSLSREDRGGHSCEVMWVDKLSIITSRFQKE